MEYSSQKYFFNKGAFSRDGLLKKGSIIWYTQLIFTVKKAPVGNPRSGYKDIRGGLSHYYKEKDVQ